jgi:NADP-dependent 3-hydroxy acid dehydrogenase YdfG
MANKVAVVTGAGSGIGKASALALLNAGYSVALAGRRAELLNQAVSESGAGARALAVPTDVSKPADVTALFAKTKEKFGSVDVLFNNAGTNAPGILFEDLTYEKWQSVVDVNLTGMFLCAQAAFRIMKEQTPRGGRIINNGSISAHAPRPDSAPVHVHQACGDRTHQMHFARRPQVRHRVRPGRRRQCNDRTRRPHVEGVKQANGEVAVEAMMDVKEVANAVVHMASLPLSTNIQFVTIMATKMPFVGRG